MVNKTKPLIFGFLEFIKSSNKICSILTNNSKIFDIVGFVKKYDNKWIEILQVDENAENDGLIKIDLNSIEKITCCSNDEIKLEVLYNMKG